MNFYVGEVVFFSKNLMTPAIFFLEVSWGIGGQPAYFTSLEEAVVLGGSVE
jgi:hypothetical protein